MPLPDRHFRTALTALLLALTTLLGGCSLWPKALSFSSEPKTETVLPPPAIAEPAPTASAAPTVTELPKLDETPAAQAVTAPALVAAAPNPMAKITMAPGFYINVGLYAKPDNANTAYRKLEKAGLPVFSDVVTKAAGTQTRVRVGPYLTRAKANTAAKKIKALKLDAVVFKH